jgi:hypothetical protein
MTLVTLLLLAVAAVELRLALAAGVEELAGI